MKFRYRESTVQFKGHRLTSVSHTKWTKTSARLDQQITSRLRRSDIWHDVTPTSTICLQLPKKFPDNEFHVQSGDTTLSSLACVRNIFIVMLLFQWKVKIMRYDLLVRVRSVTGPYSCSSCRRRLADVRSSYKRSILEWRHLPVATSPVQKSRHSPNDFLVSSNQLHRCSLVVNEEHRHTLIGYRVQIENVFLQDILICITDSLSSESILISIHIHCNINYNSCHKSRCRIVMHRISATNISEFENFLSIPSSTQIRSKFPTEYKDEGFQNESQVKMSQERICLI